MYNDIWTGGPYKPAVGLYGAVDLAFVIDLQS